MLSTSEPDQLAGERVTLEAARSAVTRATSKLTELLRVLPGRSAPVVGEWTAGEVAAHLAHVAELDAEAVRGRGPRRPAQHARHPAYACSSG